MMNWLSLLSQKLHLERWELSAFPNGNAEGVKATSHITKISTLLTVQVMVIFPLVMQNLPALLDVQCKLVQLSLAGWQVPNQVAFCHCYMTTVHTNAQAHDLPGLIPTVKCCRATGTSMVSKHTVY